MRIHCIYDTASSVWTCWKQVSLLPVTVKPTPSSSYWLRSCLRGKGEGENRYTDASANIHVHTSCNISSVIFFLLLFCFLTWSYLFTCLPVACSRLLLVCRSALTKAHSLLAERKTIISPLFCHHRLRKGRQETWERRMTCNKVLEMSRCQNYKATNYRSSAALLQWGGGLNDIWKDFKPEIPEI